MDCQRFPSAGPPRAIEAVVATFNVRYAEAPDDENRWSDRRAAVVETIRRITPDAIGLQEPFAAQLSEILAALPDFRAVDFARDPSAPGGERTPILYRADRFAADEAGIFWLSDAPETPASRTWGNDMPRACVRARLVERATGAAFHLFNTHLDAWTPGARVRSAALLAERIRGRRGAGAAVLVGDMNDGPASPALRSLTGGPTPSAGLGSTSPMRLVDALAAAHPAMRPEDRGGTFHEFTGRTDGERIDFVLVEPGVEVLAARIVREAVGGRWPSDHFPVVARLRLPA